MLTQGETHVTVVYCVKGNGNPLTKLQKYWASETHKRFLALIVIMYQYNLSLIAD